MPVLLRICFHYLQIRENATIYILAAKGRKRNLLIPAKIKAREIYGKSKSMSSKRNAIEGRNVYYNKRRKPIREFGRGRN